MDERVIATGGAVKALGGGKIGGYLVAWGTPEERDLEAEYFTPDTEFELGGKSELPILFHHGMDAALRAKAIGRITSWKKDDVGLWVEGILDERDEYVRAIEEMIDKGVLGWSSGSMPHQVQVTAGHIKYWPIYEGSATHTPADWRGATRVTSVKSLADLQPEWAAKERVDAKEPPAADAGSGFSIDSVSEDQSFAVKASGDKVMDAIEMALTAVAEVLGREFSEDELAAIQARLQELMPAMEEAAAAETPEEMKADDDAAAPNEAIIRIVTAKAIEVVSELDAAARKASPAYQAAVAAAKAAAQETAAPVAGYVVPANGGKKAAKPFSINRGVENTPLLTQIRDLVGLNGHIAQSRAKSMSHSIGPLGGYLTRREVSSDILEYLYANEVALAAGATRLNITGLEQFTVYRQKTGATAYYIGEAQEITASDITFEAINVSPKKLAARVVIANDWLKRTDIGAEAFISEQIRKALTQQMDIDCLRGDGGVPSGSSGVKPLGLLNVPGVTITSLGTNGAKPQPAHLSAMVGRVENANVTINRGAWISAPRTKRYFGDLTDANGLPVYRSGYNVNASAESITPEGYPFYTTTQIPVALTVGSSTDCSELYFGNWEDCAVAIGYDVAIDADSSQYFSSDMTQIRAIMAFDFVVYRPEAFEILTGVRA